MAEPTARSRNTPLTLFRIHYWIILALCMAILGTNLLFLRSAQAGSKITTVNHTTGGYAVGSSNTVAHYVKLENFRALIRATRKYGQYPINL